MNISISNPKGYLWKVLCLTRCKPNCSNSTERDANPFGLNLLVQKDACNIVYSWWIKEYLTERWKATERWACWIFSIFGGKKTYSQKFQETYRNYQDRLPFSILHLLCSTLDLGLCLWLEVSNTAWFFTNRYLHWVWKFACLTLFFFKKKEELGIKVGLEDFFWIYRPIPI